MKDEQTNKVVDFKARKNKLAIYQTRAAFMFYMMGRYAAECGQLTPEVREFNRWARSKADPVTRRFPKEGFKEWLDSDEGDLALGEIAGWTPDELYSNVDGMGWLYTGSIH